MLLTNVNDVRKEYRKAAGKGWVLPCICTENLTTTEAILTAAHEFGKDRGIDQVPVVLAITCLYDHRSQAPNYTHTRDYKTGLRLFVNDVKALADKGGLYENLNVMLHLDHIQAEDDIELLESDLSDYASIMYDASALPFEENIRRTAEFVKKRGHEIMIEGACDEIVDATGNQHYEMTTPENALRYVSETGVDLIVANLGTEHRATGKELHYYGDIARSIKEKIGEKIVLHGTSSVQNDQVAELFSDGVVKVNIWTALERDSSPVLFEELVKNSCRVAGAETVSRLIKEGYLTEKCQTNEKISIANFTTVSRQDIVFNKMKKIVREYLDLWYR